MDDQARVRVGHRARDLRDQRRARADVELVLAAVDIDGLALDVLEREIRPAVLRDARVVQACDVRMLERGEDLALLRSALGQLRQRPPVRQLQGDLPPQDAVSALGQPDRAHAAFADGAQQPIRADHATHDRRGRDRRRTVLARADIRRAGTEAGKVVQEVVGLVLGMLLQQRRDGRLEPGLGGVQRREPGLALLDRKLEASLQEREDFLEISGREILHDGAQTGAGIRGSVLHGSRRLLNPPAPILAPAGRRIASPRRSGTMAA